jgi:hypothetical protein
MSVIWEEQNRLIAMVTAVPCPSILGGRLPECYAANSSGRLVSEPSGVQSQSIANAGEVGDGPDQGHSGGADSVPPAPNSPLAVGMSAFFRRRRSISD